MKNKHTTKLDLIETVVGWIMWTSVFAFAFSCVGVLAVAAQGVM